MAKLLRSILECSQVWQQHAESHYLSAMEDVKRPFLCLTYSLVATPKEAPQYFDFAGFDHLNFALIIALIRHRSARGRNHFNGPQQVSDYSTTVYGKVHGRYVARMIMAVGKLIYFVIPSFTA